jgi:hypothetical protein
MRCCYKREWRKERWRVRESIMGFGQEGVKKINGFIRIWEEKVLGYGGGSTPWRELREEERGQGMMTRLRSSPCTCNERLRGELAGERIFGEI